MFKKNHSSNAQTNSIYTPVVGGTGCCGEVAGTEKKYTATTDFSNAVLSITIDGTVYTFATTGTDAATWKAGVRAAFVSAGYQDVEMNGVRSTISGSDVTIEVYTTATVATFTDAGGALAVTAFTTLYYLCDYRTTFVGSPGPVTVDGTTPTAMSTGTYAYDAADPATNATVAGTIDTEFTAAYTTSAGAAPVAVTVLVNDTVGAYDVIVKAAQGTEVKLGASNVFAQDGCVKDFQ